MQTLIYDSCFLYNDTQHHDIERFGIECFGVVGLQIDDSFIVEDNVFVDGENKKLKKLKLLAKNRQKFIIEQSIKFNGESINKNNEGNIYLNQNNQCKNLRLVNLKEFENVVGIKGRIKKAVTSKNQYIVQRAKKIYIVTVSQSETAFDLFFAAQIINSKKENAKVFNKRLV